MSWWNTGTSLGSEAQLGSAIRSFQRRQVVGFISPGTSRIRKELSKESDHQGLSRAT
jgi:hypothetical protein